MMGNEVSNVFNFESVMGDSSGVLGAPSHVSIACVSARVGWGWEEGVNGPDGREGNNAIIAWIL